MGVGWRHPTVNFFKILYILPFKKSYEYLSVIFVYKALNDLNRCNWFTEVSGTYNTRRVAGGDIEVPRARTELFKKSCRISAVLYYNRIPVDIRNLSNYNAFKVQCKKYLHNRDSET